MDSDLIVHFVAVVLAIALVTTAAVVAPEWFMG